MSKAKKTQREDFKQEEVLQAVVIADSFNVRFAPITQHKPRTLLPLVNRPLLDYTLDFLGNAGIEHCIVFCCAHAEQVRRHIENTEWSRSSSTMKVQTLMSERCLSAGDALREIDAQSLISGDFVLVNGDIVANVKLKKLISDHKARRLREKKAIMTMLMKCMPPGHHSRCQEEQVILATTRDNIRLLSYKPAHSQARKFDFPLEIFLENGHVDLRYNMMSSNICICSNLVLPLFTDEFDFQTVGDFVKGILDNEEIHGHTIHIEVIEDEYATAVSNLHMYDSVSKDVMNRWLHPMVPEYQGNHEDQDGRYTYSRHNTYLHTDLTLESGCLIHDNVMIGKGTSVGSKTTIANSVIGKNCKIGKNVVLNNAYVWDNVTIEDGCILNMCLIDCKVHLKPNVTLKPGCVLALNVVVGPDVTLPEGTLLSSRPPEDDGFDDEASNTEIDPSFVGNEGVAYKYTAMVDSDDEAEELAQDVWGIKIESEEEEVSDDMDSDLEEEAAPHIDEDSDRKLFFEELIKTLERAVEEKIPTENQVLEVNSLKAAYGLQIQEVNAGVTTAVFEFPLRSEPNLEPPQYLTKMKLILSQFLPLLQNYARSEDSQKDCLGALEETAVNSLCIKAALLKLLHQLYQDDLFGEEALLAWFTSANPAIKKQVLPFMKWLQEAEEETESESDED